MSKVEIIQDKAAFETTDVVSDHHYFILEMDLRIRKKFDLENLYLIASKTKISIFFSNRPSANLEVACERKKKNFKELFELQKSNHVQFIFPIKNIMASQWFSGQIIRSGQVSTSRPITNVIVPGWSSRSYIVAKAASCRIVS